MSNRIQQVKAAKYLVKVNWNYRLKYRGTDLIVQKLHDFGYCEEFVDEFIIRGLS